MPAHQLSQAILSRVKRKIITAKQASQTLQLEPRLEARMPCPALEQPVASQRGK
jgi:hypothetical protein